MQTAERLKDAVRSAYSAAAKQPSGDHAFPVGRSFAENVGYPPEVLDTVPSVACEAFAGVSCVSIAADIQLGMRVLDLGCGAGLDSLIAAERVGETGHVSGVDFSETMLGRAERAASKAHADTVEFCRADAAELPYEDASFDLVLINGIFNLNPVRDGIFRELARVVRPLGSVWAAELVLKNPRFSRTPMDEATWFA